VSGRQHHLLSDLEKDIYQLLLWANVLDIREQYPLQLHTTDLEFIAPGSLQIANSMGLRHPMIRTNEPRVMTTDFLVTLQNRCYVAIYAKYSHESSSIEKPRKEELYQIANSYWHARGIKLLKVSELDIAAGAIAWCDWFADSLKTKHRKEKRQAFLIALKQTDPSHPMRVRLELTAAKMNWSTETCKTLLAHAVFYHDVQIPLKESPDYSIPWQIEHNLTERKLPKWHFLSRLLLDHEQKFQ
jgi:hypothetical protein